ncbi:CPBP family glutamic-type intramembrane protease [Phenylobacterium sp. LjRoot225]|uniref:CPBP family glutamic-type intramembrane protease n=1 Tax=Phenylobacterium sp. LjRoot225 TaxID=3342285 RepID=UPI003ECCA810
MSARAEASLQRLAFDNPWIVGVRSGRRAAPPWLVLLVGVSSAVAIGALARGLGPEIPAAVSAHMPGAIGVMLGVAALYLVVFLPLWVTAGLGGLAEGRVVWRAERHAVLAGAAGLLLALGGFAIAVGLAAGAGVVRAGGGAIDGGTTSAVGVALGLLVFGYQAGAEEVLFRGWMQPVLCARFGPWIGLVTVAASFGLLHLAGAPHGQLAILNLMLAGLMFGLLALRSGGLWAAFGAHAGWNWIEACGLGLDPNPGLGPFGALVDLDLVGRAVWSGGPDGLTGSLALTLVLSLIVGGLLVLRPRTHRRVAMGQKDLRIHDAARCHQGKVREVNEDSVLARPREGLWAVADGMGGHANGQWASQTVVAALEQASGDGDEETRARAASDALHAANSRIWAQAQTVGRPMGSTVAALLLHGPRFVVLWAGDSRCYLLRDGVIRQLTTDHSHVQHLVATGRLAPQEAATHPMAHVLSRAVGAQAQLDLEMVADEARAGDAFLLCSDGLTRVVGDPEIAAMMKGKLPAVAAEQMVAVCLERGAPDNVSVVIVHCEATTSLALA